MSSENRDLSSQQPTPPLIMHPANNSHQSLEATPILNNLLSKPGVSHDPTVISNPQFDPQQSSSSLGVSTPAPLMVQPMAGSFHSPQPSPAHGFSDGIKTEQQDRYVVSVPSSSAGPGQFGMRKPPAMLPPGQWPPQHGTDGMPYPGPHDPSQQQQPPPQMPPGYGPPPQGHMYPQQQHPYWQPNRYPPPPHGYGPPPQHMISPHHPAYGVPTNPAYGVPTPGGPPPMIQQVRQPGLPGQNHPQEWPKTNGQPQPPVSMAHQPNFPTSQAYAQPPQPSAHPSLAYQPQPYNNYQRPKEETTAPTAQAQSSTLPIQSPSTASVPDESLDDVKSMRSSPSIPQTPATGQRTPHTTHPGPSSTPSSTSAQHSNANHPPKLTRQEILEKLVNEPAPIQPETLNDRRRFFDLLLALNENNAEPLTGPPQVSKSVVDLYNLYRAVREKGGFETIHDGAHYRGWEILSDQLEGNGLYIHWISKVTKEKAWKNMCTKANATMSESSAAGYQLRRHYQRHLLVYECRETGANAATLVEFAEKLKKKKKDKDPNAPDKKSAAQQQQHAQVANAGPPQPPPGYPMHHPHPQQGAPPPYGQPGPSYPGHPGDPNAFYYGHPHGPPPGQHHPGWMQPPQHGYPPGHYPPPGSMHRMPSHPGIRPPNESMYDERQHPYYSQNQHQYPGVQHPPQQPPPNAPPTAPHPHQYPPYSIGMPTHSNAPTPYTSSMPPSSKPDGHPPPSASTIPLPSSASRAPSAGPPQAGTPDSTSRISASGNDEQTRPSSQQPPYSTPTPSSSYAANAPTPPMTTSVGPPGPGPMGQPPPASGNYYPNNMYMPPRAGVPPSSMQQQPPTSMGQPQTIGQPNIKPPYGNYPGMDSGSYPPPGPHPMYTHHPGIWQPGQSRYPGYMPGPGNLPPAPGQVPPRTQPPFDYQRPQQPQYKVNPPPFGAPPPSHQQPPAASPGSNQKLRSQLTAPPMTTTTTSSPFQTSSSASSSSASQRREGQQPGLFANQPNSFPSQHSSQSHHTGPPQPSTLAGGPFGLPGMGSSLMQFPSGTVEATSLAHQRRRKKLLAKDLISAHSKRLIMALRSGLDFETVWAVNALNVILYDDTTPPLNLNALAEILDLVVEHLRAVLEILFPQTFEKVSTHIDEATDENPDEDFWAIKSEEELKTPMKQQILRVGGAKGNFTFKTITGRKVNTSKKGKDKPLLLKKYRPSGFKTDEAIKKDLPTTDEIKRDIPKGRGVGMAKRLYANLYAKLQAKAGLPKPEFSARTLKVKEELKTDEKMANLTEFIGDSNCVTELSNRCLALSNIIRGFSFIPGYESILSKHKSMLYIIGRFIRLMEEETTHEPSNRPLSDLFNDDIKKENETPTNGPAARSGSANSDVFSHRLGYNPDKKPKGTTVTSDENTNITLLQETANQLREDAFTILAHISVQLDLNEFDTDIAWPIFDGLLHWGVSKSLQAKDPLHMGILSPKSYVLETICKMSVLDTNVDLLISTGPWHRMEDFVRTLCSLISLSEETQNREFAIVVLNAMCIASEAVCLVAALHSPVVKNLVSFIEYADSNMHQIVTQQGIQVLRENSELMGTSVSMLRRAAQTLLQIARHESCRGEFHKFQSQLLQFTISHFMDSRVAGYITEVLYELQRPSEEMDEMSDEEKPALPKIYDDDEIIPNAPTTPIDNAAFKSSQVDSDESTIETINGTLDDDPESNGQCSPNKKRKNSDQTYKNDSEQSNHEMENYEERPPAKKNASAEVKEKLRNNILKHEAEQFQQMAHDDYHKTLINGISMHKMNGTDSNTLRVNDLRKSSDGNASANSSATAPSPGSMTIVA